MHAHSCAAVTFQLQQTGTAEGFVDWSPVNSVGLLYPFCYYPCKNAVMFSPWYSNRAHCWLAVCSWSTV